MGCQAVTSVSPLDIQQTLFGVIKIHVKSLYIQNETSTQQVYINLKMTNQSHRTKDLQPGTFEHIDENAEFIVNSRYQKYGRSLSVQLFEKGVISDSPIGVGLIDMEMVIKYEKNSQLKAYLNHENIKVGWVDLHLSFQELPTFPITFLFDSALIRRKISRIGSIKCKIRTTIGQQVLQTSISEDKEDEPPSWKNQSITFYVVKNKSKEGKIEILDGQGQIGSISINLLQIDQSKQPLIEINQEFHFNQEIVAGTIKLKIRKGQKMIDEDNEMKKSSFVAHRKIKLPPINIQNHLKEEKQEKKSDKEKQLIRNKNKQQEQARKHKEEEQARKHKEEEQARKHKEEEQARKHKEEEQARKHKEEEQARKHKEEEQARKHKEEEQARKHKEEEQARKHKEEEQARKHKEEEQARKHKEEEQARKHKEEEQARKHKEEEQARKHKEEEQARKHKEEEQARKHKEEEQARKHKEEEQARKHKEEEQARKHKEEEQARKHKEEEQARKHKEEEEARKHKEEEQARKHKEEEQARKKQLEQEAARHQESLSIKHQVVSNHQQLNTPNQHQNL